MGKPLINMANLTIGDLYVIRKHEVNYISGEAQWVTRCLKTGELRIMLGSHLRSLKSTQQSTPDHAERRRQNELKMLIRDLKRSEKLEQLLKEQKEKQSETCQD